MNSKPHNPSVAVGKAKSRQADVSPRDAKLSLVNFKSLDDNDTTYYSQSMMHNVMCKNDFHALLTLGAYVTDADIYMYSAL